MAHSTQLLNMDTKFSQKAPLGRHDVNPEEIPSRRRPRSGFLSLYCIAAVAIDLSLLYLEIPNYIHYLNDGIKPKYLYYAFFGMVAPLLLVNFRALLLYLASPFSLWAFAFIILNVAHLSVALLDGDGTRASLIDERTQCIVLSLLLGFACAITRTASVERIFPLLAVMIPALVIWDFLDPGVFYSTDTERAVATGVVPGRAAATFLNPGKAGEAMLLTYLLAIAVLRPRYRVLLLFLVGAGIMLTFARAAILCWMLLWLFLVLRRAVPKYTLAVPLLALGVLPLLLASFESYLSGREDLAEGLDNILARLEFFQDRVLDDDSALERAQVLEAGVDLFLENPIFGAGAGATDLWSLRGSTHNQPVKLAAEYGVFGIALWVWLAVILWKGKHFQDKTFQLAAVIAFAFLSMFTHNMFGFLYWLLTFALISGQRRA